MKFYNNKKDLDWLFDLKQKIPLFLQKLKGKKRDGFYHYSFSGDYIGERIKWGLGNSVFFLKIIYTLGLESNYKQEIKEAIKFIQSFQKKNGSFYDQLISILSFPLRLNETIKTRDFSNVLNKQTIRAETRQAFSALSLFNIKPYFTYKNIPNNKEKIDKYLKRLSWDKPWGAGSHFSHLLFFLHHSEFDDKDALINYAINWINKLQHEKDGFWYKGIPSIQQKINGAMKIITGLKVVNKIDFKYPKKIIDNVLLAKNDEQACDNFNITYVLKYCYELTEGKYRTSEIKDFMYDRLNLYKEHYHPEKGGFSFKKNKASNYYYWALISRGKDEPDIHGTVLFLWGLSLITQVLNLNEKFQLKEHIT